MDPNQDEIPKKAMGFRVQEILKKKPYLDTLFPEKTGSSPGPLVFFHNKTDSGDTFLEYAPSSDPTERRPLSSRRNPSAEAARIVPRWDLKGTEIILLEGLGNPNALSELLKIRKPGQITIAIECHQELVQLLIREESEPLLSFLEQSGCHLFTGQNMILHYKTYLDTIPPDRISGIRVAAHSPSVQLCPDYYTSLLQSASSAISSKISDLMTRFEFEKLWMKNIIANTVFYTETQTESTERTKAPNPFIKYRIPGILVSAGPSLKDSLPLLRELQDRSFLLAADTALKVLLKNGVRPHAVFTLDAQKHSRFHFLGEDLSGITLFADIVADPVLLRIVNPDTIIFSVTARFVQDAAGNMRREVTPGSEFFEEFSDSLISLQSGGSVATTAFDLLRNLGVSEICLIGQDLAYTGRKIHSTGTHHNERWLPSLHRLRSLEFINESVIRKRDTDFTDSLSGGKILTDFVLNLYRSWFEESIAGINLPVFNLTSEGAEIKGTIRPAEQEIRIRNTAGTESPPEGESLRSEIREFFASVAASDSIKHSDADIYRVLKDLNESVSDFLKDKLTSEVLTEKFPWLEKTARRAMVYSLRHKDSLSNEKKEQLFNDALKKELKDLLRFSGKLLVRNQRQTLPAQSEE